MQGRNSEGSGKERGRDARHGRRRPRLLVRRRRDGHGRRALPARVARDDLDGRSGQRCAAVLRGHEPGRAEWKQRDLVLPTHSVSGSRRGGEERAPHGEGELGRRERGRRRRADVDLAEELARARARARRARRVRPPHRGLERRGGRRLGRGDARAARVRAPERRHREEVDRGCGGQREEVERVLVCALEREAERDERAAGVLQLRWGQLGEWVREAARRTGLARASFWVVSKAVWLGAEMGSLCRR
jgi:hypothetical protein